MNLKESIKKFLGVRNYILFVRWVRDHFYGWHSRYYAEYGEDSIVNCLIHYKREGIYVDVGAFHPKRLSSTYYFYKKQHWSGIIVEPNPVNCALFQKYRPRDIIVNMGAAKTKSELTYYMFEDASQNTFSEEFKEDRVKEEMAVIDQKIIPVKPLSEILDENLLKGQMIDYLNIDVEGLDLEVLQSNDWERFRPSVITVEDIRFDIEKPTSSDIFNFLKEQNYNLRSVSHITLVFTAHEFK